MTAKIPASAYPTQAAIVRALKAAEASGMKASGFRIAPGGVIEVFDMSAAPPRDEFAEWLASRREPNDFDT
jgi:hypothetical protein